MFIPYNVFHLHELPRIGKFIQAKSRIEIARGQWEEKMGSYSLIGTEFMLGMMTNFLGIVSGDGDGYIVNVFNTTNSTLVDG